jgi:hypothetical protein
LFAGLPASEFDAWEWRKAELMAFARALGIPTTGAKAALAPRIRKRLHANTQCAAAAQRDVRDSPAVTPLPLQPTVEVHTSSSSRDAGRAFFQAAPGMSRAQSLAQWYATRTVVKQQASR